MVFLPLCFLLQSFSCCFLPDSGKQFSFIEIECSATNNNNNKIERKIGDHQRTKKKGLQPDTILCTLWNSKKTTSATAAATKDTYIARALTGAKVNWCNGIDGKNSTKNI